MLRQGQVYLVTMTNKTSFVGTFFEGDDTWAVFAPYIREKGFRIHNEERAVPIANVSACDHMPGYEADLNRVSAERERLEEASLLGQQIFMRAISRR